ncbi:hypothetical protein GCM10011584_18230 [Nocardioides phosphati]|uniref:Uncharacterized protein n=1 Tax=Nocardioides phosphati TaxID=1867775 RepID=A0ABQ2NEQ4_9ACTN|nr:hypothetical protein [Nocardioides phosphati]GGO89260.1 hypothetical protein GCM10011584_18230 [Nocardioides phosphati]
MTIHQIRPDLTTTEASTTLAEAPTRRQRLEPRHAREIVELLGRKEELRGVYAMADFLDDAVRWTA